MKKLFAGILLSVAAVAALASPRPSEIENALAAHDYQSAKSMTEEVLRDHPNSAKAHLFEAYILAKEGNAAAAKEELKNVNRLDRSNGPGNVVSNSALYGRTVAELDRAAPQRVAPQRAYVAPVQVQTPTYVEPAQRHGSALMSVLKLLFWVTIIGIIVYVIYKLLNRREVVSCTGHVYVDTSEQQSVRPYRNHGRSYDAPAHAIPAPMYQTAPVESRYDTTPRPVVYAAPAQAPAQAPASVIVNNTGSNSNGLVEGMMLNEMMHSHHNHADYASPRVIERDVYVERDTSYSRDSSSSYSAPATQDYETERKSYSSGSDDSWSSSSSSSSYSSSSSSDSWGSSSSSYDSGSSSSYDSGSSGGSDSW